MDDLIPFIVLALACGQTSIMITRSRFFNRSRQWMNAKSTFLGALVNCPYCMVHWIVFVVAIIWHPFLTNCGFWPADFLISVFALVALSAFVAGSIWRIFTPPSVNPMDLKKLLDKTQDSK